MVHWPETMATWCAEERTIFSGDAFGTFGALNGGVTDEQLDVEPFWEEMRRYYACIVGKYGQPVQRALAKVAPLDIAMICSTHGPVWRREIARVVELYDKVSRYEGEPGAVIAYGSMYGNTEQMAETVARGLAAAGVRPIVVYNLSTADVSSSVRRPTTASSTRRSMRCCARSPSAAFRTAVSPASAPLRGPVPPYVV